MAVTLTKRILGMMLSAALAMAVFSACHHHSSHSSATTGESGDQPSNFIPWNADTLQPSYGPVAGGNEVTLVLPVGVAASSPRVVSGSEPVTSMNRR